MIRIALCLAVIASAASPVRADDAKAKADVLFEKANANYQSGQYQAAIEQFKQAYDLVHDPIYLFNLAQSYRKVLDCEPAYDYYKRYLEAAPNAENKTKVQQWLVELQPCVEQRQKEHEAARRGEEAERQERARQQQLHPRAAVSQQREVDAGGPYRTAGYVAAGVGVLGIAVGVIYSVKGGNVASQLATTCTPTCRWDSADVKALDSEGRTDNTVSAIGWVGGGVAALAGVGLYLYGRTKVEHVVVIPTEGGATVSARLRF